MTKKKIGPQGLGERVAREGQRRLRHRPEYTPWPIGVAKMVVRDGERTIRRVRRLG